MRLLFLFLICTALLSASIVIPSLGPNPWGTPSLTGYWNNVLTGLRNDTTGIGTPGTPTFYVQAINVFFEDVTVTNYPSWRGVAGPPAPFDQESGTSLFFGVHLISDSPFTIDQVTFTESSTDPPNPAVYPPGNYWGWTGPLSTQDIAYMAAFDENGNAIADFTTSTSIYELVFVGIAGGFDAATYNGYSADQAGLSQAIADYKALGMHTVTTCYAVEGQPTVGTCGSVVVGTPEPATFGLFAPALLALFWIRRRKT